MMMPREQEGIHRWCLTERDSENKNKEEYSNG